MFKKFLILIIIMTTIWGLLSKSLVDNEKIEEAINRLIAAHNADETAHLDVGQSLQSHKASEIIDHLASSIIADKIANREIELVHLYDFNIERHSLSLESIDGWDTTGGLSLWVGTLELATGSVINTWRYAYASTWEGVQFTKTMVAQWRARWTSSADLISAIFVGIYGLGDPAGQAFGFKVVSGALYAFWLAGPLENSVEYTQLITGVTITSYHIYRVEYDPGVSIKFYVDDVLKYTASANLPDTTWGTGAFCGIEIKNLVAVDKKILVSQVYFTAE